VPALLSPIGAPLGTPLASSRWPSLGGLVGGAPLASFDDGERRTIAPAPMRDRVDDDGAKEDDKKERPVRVGALIGVGFPSVLNAGLTVRITRYLGIGANAGMLPETRLPVSGQATVAYTEYDAYVRVYPLGGGFLLGTGIGYEKLRGSLTESVTATVPGLGTQHVELGTQATMSVLILTPHIGYLHTFGSGLTLGAEVGAQVPVSASDVSVQTTLPTGTPAEITTSMQSEQAAALRRLGQTVLPSLSLRAGWMF